MIMVLPPILQTLYIPLQVLELYYMQLIALDSGSCNIADTLILPVVVTAPPCSIILDDSSNVSCFGGNDGFITVQGSESTNVFAYLQVLILY